MKYKLVIFDFDGTISDSFQWFISVSDHVADRFKFKRINKDEIDSLRGFDAKKMLKHHGVPLWKMPMIANYMRKLMTKEIDKITLFKGVDKLLKTLKDRGVILALVTSNSYENSCKILGPENAAMMDYFECGVSLFSKKPKLKKVIRKSGIPKRDAVVICDEIRDVQAAQAVNIPVGVVSWGYTDVEALKTYSPDEVFANIDEIVEKIA